MNNQNNLSCCQQPTSKKKGFSSGILYGLIPHCPCIAFILFSVLGVTFAASFLKPLLLNRYFFYFLISLSLLLATLSAFFYLRRNKILNWFGIKKAKKYLLTLYLTTVVVNLLFFLVIFPALANLGNNTGEQIVGGNVVTLEVDLPCPGHAYLVTEDLKKLAGIQNIKFRMPNLFDVSFNSQIISPKEILNIDVLKIYQGKVIEQGLENEACTL